MHDVSSDTNRTERAGRSTICCRGRDDGRRGCREGQIGFVTCAAVTTILRTDGPAFRGAAEGAADAAGAHPPETGKQQDLKRSQQKNAICYVIEAVSLAVVVA